MKLIHLLFREVYRHKERERDVTSQWAEENVFWTLQSIFFLNHININNTFFHNAYIMFVFNINV